MGVFKLPYSVCDDLTRLVRNFWWGSKQAQRKTQWCAWDKLLEQKGKGGLGFRDFRLFNQTLLVRQAWRLLINPDLLCSQVLTAKYYPNGSLEDAVFSGNASPTWQAIQNRLELLKKGFIWWVGNDEHIRIWHDPWIPQPTSYRPITPRATCRLQRVSELLDINGRWRTDLLQQHFMAPDVQCVLAIKASPRRLEDVLSWAPDARGIFSVRST
jgi:hypothetical protein